MRVRHGLVSFYYYLIVTFDLEVSPKLGGVENPDELRGLAGDALRAVRARPAIGRARWGALGVKGTGRGCVVTRVSCANLCMRPYGVTSDARERREIEGPLRQRGGRAVRRPTARGGGWAREERLSGSHTCTERMPIARVSAAVCGVQ